MAMTATVIKRHGVGGVTNGIFSIAATGSYSTGGDAIDFASAMGYTTRKPDYVDVKGIAGYSYAYDRTNNKILVFQNGASAGTVTATFTGTATKPTFTVGSGTFATNAGIGLSADSASATVQGGSAITTDRTLTTTSPVGTVTPTGVVAATLAGTAGGQSELPATTYPAGVSGDTITAFAVWVSTPSLGS